MSLAPFSRRLVAGVVAAGALLCAVAQAAADPTPRTPNCSAAGVAAAAALTAVASSWVVPVTGVANAGVCASVGRRVSVSECTNLAEPRRRVTKRRCRGISRLLRPRRT